MSVLKQSFSWDGFARTGVDPVALMRGAADIGLVGVEMLPQQYFLLAREFGLQIVTNVGHKLAHEGLNRREHRDRIEAELRVSLDLAAAWHIPFLIVFSGNRDGLSDDEGAEIAADNLRYFAPMAEAVGVTLLLELLNSKLHGRDYMADHTAWGVRVCQMVDSPHVRLLYDIFHMQVMEGDIIRTIQAGHPYIGHYHAAGNPGRSDLDDEQELYYPAIIRALRRTGYDGFFGHEFMPKGDPLQSLQAAVELCERAWSV